MDFATIHHMVNTSQSASPEPRERKLRLLLALAAGLCHAALCRTVVNFGGLLIFFCNRLEDAEMKLFSGYLMVCDKTSHIYR